MAEDVARLMKHAHDLERRGRKADAELTYSAASEIARMRTDLAWQPIKTAPKDATQILVCGPRVGGGIYMDVAAWPVGWDLLWPVAYMAYAAGEPTHWMPLPPPPEPIGCA